MILLTWFGSFPGHGTLGDLLALQAAANAVAATKLSAAYAAPSDFGLSIPLMRVDWDRVDPYEVDTLVFVCGPILRTHGEQRRLFTRFRHCRKIGVGVSLFPHSNPDRWDPFDHVFAREGGLKTWFDLALAAPLPNVVEQPETIRNQTPTIGLSLRGAQFEYADRRCFSELAGSLLAQTSEATAASRNGSIIEIENHLYRALLNPREVEAQYKRCSLILTTRLHGALLAIRHGVPFIVIDQIEGGAKVAGILSGSGWPCVYRVEDIDAPHLIRMAKELIDAPPRQLLHSVRTNLESEARNTLDAFVECLSGPSRRFAYQSNVNVSCADRDIAFLLCSEAGIIERHSLLLVESIRRRGGELCHAPIYAVCPRRGFGVSALTRKRFRSLGVTYIEEPLNEHFPGYPLVANKPIAARFIERNTDHEVIVTLDTDTLFLNEPRALLLAVNEDVALRPADMRGIAMTRDDELFRGYWNAFSELAGVDLEGLPIITTRVDRREVKAYYQTGLVAVRRSRGIFNAWGDLLEMSLSQGVIPEVKGSVAQCSVGELTGSETLVWGADIAALSLAIWGLTDRVRVLPSAYNYPLHLPDQMAKDDRFQASRDLVHVHYHWMFDADHLARNLLLGEEFDLEPGIRKLLIPYIPMDREGVIQKSYVSSVRQWLVRSFLFPDGKRNYK